MKYWAFLSYSHSDAKWGDWLHKVLETYRVPRRLIGKDSRDGKIPARLFPIFRDREELPVSADLPSNINEALRESRYLIVICSPRAAQSRWVGEEIKAFKKLGREDRILAMIIAGEPNASDGKPGFTSADECFPQPMRYRLGADGQFSSERTQPIAADAREGKDGKNNAKLKLLAGLLSINYDALKQREQERRLRRAWAVGISAVILVGLFGMLAAALFLKQREAATSALAAQTNAARARRDEEEAEIQKRNAESALNQIRERSSKSDFLQAVQLIEHGRDLDALAQLSRSLTRNPNNDAAITRLATLLFYHDYPLIRLRRNTGLWGADYRPGGKQIVIAGNDGSAFVWDLEMNRLSLECRHRGAVMSARFSADGKRIVTASFDKTARVWNADTGEPVGQPMKHEAYVYSAAFSPDGTRVVTVALDKTARLWNAETGTPLSQTFRHPHEVHSACFSHDGRRIITSSFDHYVRLWDTQTGKLVATPIQHPGSTAYLASVDFSYDDARIVTASGYAAQVWDSQTGKPIGAPMKHDAYINSARFSSDGNAIITASADRTVRLWSAASGRPFTKLMRHAGSVSSAIFSPDGKRILTASEDGSARIWDFQPAKPLHEPIKHRSETSEVPSKLPRKNDGTTDRSIQCAQFSPDGKRVVTSSADRTARVWDPQTSKPLSPPLQHNSIVWNARFSPNGLRLVTTSGPNAQMWNVQIWNAETGARVGDQITSPIVITAARFSPDSKRLLTASGIMEGNPPGEAQIWDVESGHAIGQPMTHERLVHRAEFSPDGQRVVTASWDRTARMWDGFTGKPLSDPMWHNSVVNTVLFSRDGKRIVAAASHEARVWDATSGRALSASMPDFMMESAEFAADEKTIVTGARGHARLWDTETGKALGDPIPKTGIFRLSPDGKWIVGKLDHAVRIIDPTTGALLADEMIHKRQVGSVEFSPDGHRIVTAAGDSAVIWETRPFGRQLPGWLLRLVDAVALERLNENDVFEALAENPSQILAEVREKISRDPIDDEWTTWARWFLADKSNRTISPISLITVPKYIEDRIAENTAESLDEVEQLALGNPELQARIAVARAGLPKSH